VNENRYDDDALIHQFEYYAKVDKIAQKTVAEMSAAEIERQLVGRPMSAG
jgi:hypothetical protein